MQVTLPKWVSSILLSYYLGPDHPMKLRFWSYLMTAMGHPRFTVPYFDGKISLDLRDWIQTEILTHGTFDPDVWEAIDGFAKKDEVLWDVGAHIGTIAVRALSDMRFNEVHAFEPHPKTFLALNKNIHINRKIGKAHPVALSSKSGVHQMFEGLAANTGLASFVPRWGTNAISVQCKTADEMAFGDGIETPTILKIDTEGAELMVLQGARRLLEKHPPKLIVFEAEEISGTLINADLQWFLESFGYTLRPIVRAQDKPTKEKICRNWTATRL